jgi:hypothetical protein
MGISDEVFSSVYFTKKQGSIFHFSVFVLRSNLGMLDNRVNYPYCLRTSVHSNGYDLTINGTIEPFALFIRMSR